MKMSKSKGNVISAMDTLNKYGENAVRFYFLKEGPIEKDEIFNPMQLVDNYNAHVVNEYANSLRRVSDMKFLPPPESPFVLSPPKNEREIEFITKFNSKASISSL